MSKRDGGKPSHCLNPDRLAEVGSSGGGGPARPTVRTDLRDFMLYIEKWYEDIFGLMNRSMKTLRRRGVLYGYLSRDLAGR